MKTEERERKNKTKTVTNLFRKNEILPYFNVFERPLFNQYTVQYTVQSLNNTLSSRKTLINNHKGKQQKPVTNITLYILF